MGVTSVASSAKCTLAIQKFLDTNNAPSKTLGQIGALAALLSPANKQGFEIAKEFWGRGMPTSGASCTVQIKFVKPICDEPGSNYSICSKPDDQATPFGRLDFIFEAADVYAYKNSIPESLVLCAHDTIDEITTASIAQFANKLLKAIDKAILTDMFTKLGSYTKDDGTAGDVSTATPMTLGIFTADSSAVQPVGWVPMLMQMDAMGAVGRPIVIGGSFAKAYVDSIKLAGTVHNGVTEALPFDFYYSSNYDVVAAAAVADVKGCIAFAPGEFQLVEYMDNVKTANNPKGEYFNDVFTRTVLNQPTVFGTNIPIDWRINYVAECDRYDWSMHKTVALFDVPDSTNCDGGSRKLYFGLGCSDITCPALPPA